MKLDPKTVQKFLVTNLFFITTTFAGAYVEAATIGEVKFGGGACGQNHKVSKPQEVAEGYHTLKYQLDYEFEMNQEVSKSSTHRSLGRSACMLAIPVQIKPKQRLVVKSLSQTADVKVVKATGTGQFEYDISFVGAIKKTLVKESWPKMNEQLKQKFIDVAQSVCGKDSMLRIQISSFAEKTNDVKLSLKDLEMVVAVENCP